MPSPSRRSTRSGMPPSKTSQTESSSSSISSSRPERSTRNHKPSPSPPEVTIPVNEEEEFDEEAGGEVTRCVCGRQDYPGAPIPLKNDPAGDGDLFIQCDECNVWQHGGCVGIMDQDKTPDSYYCEKCDKSLHQLHTDELGQRYSLFLPFHPEAQASQRKGSTSRNNDAKLKKERELLLKAAADLGISKRRSTTNSRHTYDEEEMLRKAIEESKRDQDTGRRGKRGRDESEDIKIDIKRRRTGSESIEAGSTLNTASLDADDSDEDAPTSKSAAKRARAQAAETQRQYEMKERERAREQQREEAAGRRSQRAGRRRGDELDAEDSKPTPVTKADSTAASSRAASPPEIEITQPSSSHKKSGGKKSKRLGRNQYTRDRDKSPPRKNASSSSGEEGGKVAEVNGSSKQSPTSDNIGTITTSTSHKAKSKQKGKASTTNGMNGERDKNGKPKFTSWDDYNAELTFVEDHLNEVIAHYESRAASQGARPNRPFSGHTSAPHPLLNGQPAPPRKGTPLANSSSVTGDMPEGGPVGCGGQITPSNARQHMTPISDYSSMPTLEHARATLRDIQVARQAFGLLRVEATPRVDAVRAAARDLGVGA